MSELQLAAKGGPQPSERTMQLVRVNNLEKDLKKPKELLEKLQILIEKEPSAEKIYSFAELAYLGAKRKEASDQKTALDLYAVSVMYTYHYLFDPTYASLRNPYDPQFRAACDLYNAALEGALRLVCESGKLVPEQSLVIDTACGKWDVTCVLRGSKWRAEDLDHFEFVNDYELKGLTNHYRQYGLGVPLVAVRRSYEGEPAAAKYYPVDLSFPVTAFLRPVFNHGSDKVSDCEHQAFLELYDPLSTTETEVAQAEVPLESDLTVPLAHFLSKPEFDALPTIGLLRPEELLKMRPDRPDPIMGLYMCQPYEPGKIPVLMVHGLWSSPMTWMEMFNDLRSSPEIREHYQFWFYLYPTGQPFWVSAAQLRKDLAESREVLDPYRQEPALDQMILIGHSMGGLLSRLQTIHSRDDFWKLVSERPFEELKAEEEVRERLHDTFFFKPNPSIRRVVTIATPHRGSPFSNQMTQWMLAKAIRMPQTLMNGQNRLYSDNKKILRDDSILEVETSIDSLSPKSPFFPVMLSSQKPPWVKYHNIVGVEPRENWIKRLLISGDGVVKEKSARMNDVVSEITVEANHSSVHGKPAAVLEIRRILHEHLAELRTGHGETRTADPRRIPPDPRTAVAPTPQVPAPRTAVAPTPPQNVVR